jgi:superfamily II DNA or RNA helicase
MTWRKTRELVFARSGGKCQRGCGRSITIDTFHCSHLRARASGGIDDPSNLEAWCQRCNLTNQANDVRDPRVVAREWQLREIDQIVRAVTDKRAATLSAAPGAGKTIFAGMVFEALREAGRVERLVVLTPRSALVDQWREALLVARHLELKTNSAIERPGQHGTVSTYQALLSPDTLGAQQQMAGRADTLLVLDEVHHVGEHIVKPAGAWARNVTTLAGGLGHLGVAAVLNLSGTLWRSSATERISTVQYLTLPDGRIQSVVDGQVTVEELIAAQQLRALDFYRHNALVKIQDWKKLEYLEANLADLDEQPAKAATRHLASITGWRQSFVSAVLDRLEWAYRALHEWPAKALIVCASQDHAHAFEAEVNTQMRERGLRPFAVSATSDDGDDAQKVLTQFREQRRVGVLCVCDMAGEGYDCPDIAVVGYASHKMTAMYVRQVVARAMRVTEREREMGQPIPAQVVLPDSQPLVEQMLAYLTPYVAELATEWREGPPPPPSPPRFTLDDAAAADDNVSIADGGREDMSGQLVRQMAGHLKPLGVPEIYAPRMIVAARRMSNQMEDQDPFDQPSREEKGLKVIGGTRGINVEEQAADLQSKLAHCAGWWQKQGDEDITIAQFQWEINRVGGGLSGSRSSWSVNQLQAAWEWAASMVRDRCRELGLTPPPYARTRSLGK